MCYMLLASSGEFKNFEREETVYQSRVIIANAYTTNNMPFIREKKKKSEPIGGGRSHAPFEYATARRHWRTQRGEVLRGFSPVESSDVLNCLFAQNTVQAPLPLIKLEIFYRKTLKVVKQFHILL